MCGFFFIFLAIGTAGASNPGPQTAILYPANILHLPPQSHAIVVDKSQQRLTLIASEKGRFHIAKTMVCATGEMDGDKKTAGDRRTPQGIYFCKTILTPPLLATKYGICALPLNYPNFIDRFHHRDGSGIWLHGIGEDRKTKSTQGCVVLGNEDLAFLVKKIHLFTTPIVIVDHVQRVSQRTLQNEAKKTLDFLRHWRNAWAHGDLKSYIACYAPTFTSKGMHLPQWRRYKHRLFERYHHRMSIQITSPTIVQTPLYRVAAFLQTFKASGFMAKGIKRLYLQTTSEGIKIIGEEWIPYTTIQQAWKKYQEKLAHLTHPPPPYRIVLATQAKKPLGEEKIDPLKEVKAFIQNWKASWEKKDLIRYASFYSKHFRSKSMDLEAWKHYKLRTFKRNGPIHLILKNLEIKPEGQRIFVRFLQIYQSKMIKDVGRKEMILCQESGGWKILRERWVRSR